jgi:large subunit ribosomal protein L45
MLKAAVVSAGVLAEPFRGEVEALPPTAWVTPSGWKARWGRWIGSLKSVYTLAKCKKLVPGWELTSFKREALALHSQVCAALAAGDRGVLRQLLTPSEYAAAKRQLKAREEGGWATVDWSLAPPLPTPADAECVHARLAMANAKDERAGFAQVTVRVRCAAAFAARDARGRVVAGGGPPAPVQDVWVMERYLGGGGAARWRVAARLDVPPAPKRERRGWLGFGRRG